MPIIIKNSLWTWKIIIIDNLIFPILNSRSYQSTIITTHCWIVAYMNSNGAFTEDLSRIFVCLFILKFIYQSLVNNWYGSSAGSWGRTVNVLVCYQPPICFIVETGLIGHSVHAVILSSCFCWIAPNVYLAPTCACNILILTIFIHYTILKNITLRRYNLQISRFHSLARFTESNGNVKATIFFAIILRMNIHLYYAIFCSIIFFSISSLIKVHILIKTRFSWVFIVITKVMGTRPQISFTWFRCNRGTRANKWNAFVLVIALNLSTSNYAGFATL